MLQCAVVGCGAFCAVTQANKHPTDRLIRLKSSPKKGNAEEENAFPHTGVTITAAASASVGGLGGGSISALRPVVLVGKGVCYDTGGTVYPEYVWYSTVLYCSVLSCTVERFCYSI